MRIRKLNFRTDDLEILEQFYASVLELPAQRIAGNEILIKIGSSDLVFTQSIKTGAFYHFAINIPANRIEEAREWLTSRLKLLWMKDYQSEIADFVNWHAKSVYFYDPAGNIVELIARFDLNNKTDEPFSSTQFLSINEVGLVFKQNEFEQRTSGLLNSYWLSYFSKQPPLPQFRAIGDDEGLFVVVPDRRNWYPTEKPAGIYPMTIQFENSNKKFEMEA